MNDSNFTPDNFPEFVAQNYRYSEVTGHYEGDKVAAAEEVRDSVEKLLRPIRDAGIPESTVQSALTDFVAAHPVGEDLDEKLGALGIGMEREIADSLADSLCKDLGPEFAELIKTDLNMQDIWRDAGDISLYLVRLVDLVKKMQSELDLDAEATLLAAKDLCYNPDENVVKLKEFFESPRFPEYGMSQSGFVKYVLGEGDSNASLLEAIAPDEDDEEDSYEDDFEDEDSCEDELSDDDAEFSKNFYTSLEEAKKVPDAFVVMEGDWGGQIYLTCPARLVKCDEATLKKLLTKIDGIEWGCNEGGGTALYFERVKTGGIGGGMGGGAVRDGLWIHDGIHPELARLIRQVISGEGTL